MKLRTQTLVAAVPLFLLLGIVGNGVAWFLKAWELRTAAERAAMSVAVALAEEATAVDAVNTVEGKAAMDRGAAQLARWDLLERITLFDEAGDAVWRWKSEAAAEAADEPLILPPGVMQKGERLIEVRSDHPVVRAVAATEAGRVEIAWRLPKLVPEIALMRRRFFIEASLAVVVGISLVWALGYLLTKDVRRLAVVTPQVGEGTFQAPEHLRVAELDDLSRTLGVLDAITHEARQKFQRTQAELEMFRTDEDLGKAFRRAWLRPIDRVLAGRRVTVRLLSEGAVCHAFGALERGSGLGSAGAGGVVWMVRLNDVPGLDTAREASAAGAELTAALADDARDVGSTIAQVASWFRLERVVVVTWSDAAGVITTHRWTPQAGVEPSTATGARAFCSDDSGATVDAGETLVKSAAAEPLPKVMAALANLLGGTGGVVALIETDGGQGLRQPQDEIPGG